MIYRIVITVGYRDAYIDFNDAKEAGDFASTFLSHYTRPADEKHIAKLCFEIINPDLDEEDQEE